MKHIGETIRKLIETKRLLKKDVAAKVGVSPTYLSTIFNQSSIDCEMLDKFCKALELSPNVFFDDAEAEFSQNDSGKSNSEVIAALNRLIEEKERTIQLLLSASGLCIGANSEQNQ